MPISVSHQFTNISLIKRVLTDTEKWMGENTVCSALSCKVQESHSFRSFCRLEAGLMTCRSQAWICLKTCFTRVHRTVCSWAVLQATIIGSALGKGLHFLFAYWVFPQGIWHWAVRKHYLLASLSRPPAGRTLDRAIALLSGQCDSSHSSLQLSPGLQRHEALLI